VFSDLIGWKYDLDQIKVPWMLVGGTGVFDSTLITSLYGMNQFYNSVSGNGLTVMARRKDADHSDMRAIGDGYMTAFFLYNFYGNKTAKKAFLGKKAEIKNNDLWQDVKVKS